MTKKFILTVAFIAALVGSMAWAGVPITLVDRIEPTDEVFIDMATTAAVKSKAQGGLPCGAVIILNGAWRSTGTAKRGGETAEEAAVAKSRLSSLQNARVYTVNEPTTEAYLTLCRQGADAIFFVNPRQDVIAAGVYPASAYNDNLVDSTVNVVPLTCISYPDAQRLLK